MKEIHNIQVTVITWDGKKYNRKSCLEELLNVYHNKQLEIDEYGHIIFNFK